MQKKKNRATLKALILSGAIVVASLTGAAVAWGEEPSGEVHASIAIPSGIGAVICGGMGKVRGLPVYEVERICILDMAPEELAARAIQAVPDLDMENIPDVTISRTETEQLQAYFVACAYSSYRPGMQLPTLQDICIRPSREEALRRGEQVLKRARSRAGIREKSL